MTMDKHKGWAEAVRPVRKLFAVNQVKDDGSLEQDGISGGGKN